jgi:hypothetical protein
MQSQVTIANFKFFLSKNLNFSNEIQIFAFAYFKVDDGRHVKMLICISRIPVVCGQSIGSVQTKTDI